MPVSGLIKIQRDRCQCFLQMHFPVSVLADRICTSFPCGTMYILMRFCVRLSEKAGDIQNSYTRIKKIKPKVYITDTLL